MSVTGGEHLQANLVHFLDLAVAYKAEPMILVISVLVG